MRTLMIILTLSILTILLCCVVLAALKQSNNETANAIYYMLFAILNFQMFKFILRVGERT